MFIITLKTYKKLLFFFLGLSLVFPTLFTYHRLSLLVILLVLAVYFNFANKIKIYFGRIFILFLFLFASIVSFVIGFVNSNPGAINSVTIYILWPLVFYTLFWNLNKSDLNYLKNTIYISYFCSINIFILFIIDKLFLDIYFLDPLLKNFDFRFSINDNFFEYYMPSLPSFLITFVYCLYSTLVPSKFRKNISILNIIILVSSFTLLLISGRSAIYIALGINFSILIVINTIHLKFKILFFAITFLLLFTYFNFEFVNNLFQFIFSSFDFSNLNNSSSHRRYVQFFQLIDAIFNNPFFGLGLGASVDEFLILRPQPWAYELSYLSMIMQSGIIGFFLISLPVIYILFNFIRNINSHLFYESLPFIMCIITLLIITASNPYIFKFDYLWLIFISLFILKNKYA